MSDKLLDFTNTDAEILMAIACFHEQNGTGAAGILAFVDSRQHMILNDAELQGGLQRLQAARLIVRRDEKYFLSQTVMQTAPRTTTKGLSLRKRDWYRLLGLKTVDKRQK